MTDVPGWAARLMDLAMRAHPRAFREQYAEDMRAYFRDGWLAQSSQRSRFVHVIRSAGGTLVTGWRQRIRSEPAGDAAGGLDGFRLDVRHAVRSLRRQPLHTCLIVATLAIGVGANAAVFQALNGVVLAPLPYPEPDRLVRLYQIYRDEPGELVAVTAPAVVHFRDNARTLEFVGPVNIYRESGVDLTGGERPERLAALRVGADYFEAVGVRPIRGRTFERADEQAGSGRVAIVSGRLAARLQGTGGIAVLDGVVHDVIGVMPEGYADPLASGVDVWLPLRLLPGGYEPSDWDNHYLTAVARLAPGVTVAQAQAEVANLSRQQAGIAADAEQLEGRLVPLHEDMVGAADTLLGVLMGAVGLLLLLACVNVTMLLAARSLSRTHEVAVRAALGSPRRRLARQFLMEGLLLAGAGGLAGLLVSVPLVRALATIAPPGLADRLPLTPPPAVVGFGLLVSLFAGVVFCFVPVARLGRVDPTSALGQAARGSTDRSTTRVRSGLVVTQVALALVLLIGAGVLLRSFERLQRVQLNLRPARVLSFEVNLPDERYSDPDARTRLHTNLTRQLGELPGVRSSGAIHVLPLTGKAYSWGVREAAGGEDREDRRWTQADQRITSGDIFTTLGIPVLHGRVFDERDDAGAPRRIVINETLARVLFDDVEGAIGRSIGVAGGPREVIGVVADVPLDARGDVVPMIYHPYAQIAGSLNWGMVHLVAADQAGGPQLDALQQTVWGLDADLVANRPRWLADVIADARSRERFAAQLMSVFAVLAALLAALGLYGILSHTVRRRRREIGIRMALGAGERSVLGLILRQVAGLTGLGLAIGILGALGLTRWLGSLVFDIGVRDPLVFGSGTLLMATVALVAAAVPALGALRTDPTEAFRTDQG